MSYQWMPLYIGDYLADTRHLDYRGHGAYLQLLMSYWRTGPLPNDDILLARLATCPLEIWKRDLKKHVMSFFTLADDRWHQKRMDAEIAHRDQISEKRAMAAEAARAAKAAKANVVAEQIDQREASRPKSPPTNTKASPETKPSKPLSSLYSMSANQSDLALSKGGQPEPEPQPDKKEKKEGGPSALSASDDAGVAPDLLPTATITRLKTSDDVEAAVASWNAMAAKHGLAQVAKLTDARRRALLARLRECNGLDGWHTALDLVTKSQFLLGITERGGWKADFDFIITQSKFTKLMEGGYPPERPRVDNRRKSNSELYAELMGFGNPGTDQPFDHLFTLDGEAIST